MSRLLVSIHGFSLEPGMLREACTLRSRVLHLGVSACYLQDKPSRYAGFDASQHTGHPHATIDMRHENYRHM